MLDPAVSKYLLIEFYSGDQVVYKRTHDRLQEAIFWTDYCVKDRDYRLEFNQEKFP